MRWPVSRCTTRMSRSLIKTMTRGAAAAFGQPELQYLPDALLYRRVERAELVAFASALCLVASGDFKREPFGFGKLRRDQSRRGT